MNSFAYLLMACSVLAYVAAGPVAAPPSSGNLNVAGGSGSGSSSSSSNLNPSGSSSVSNVGAGGANVGATIQEIEAEVNPSGVPAAVLDLTRFRKSAGGYGGAPSSGGYGASIPAPPCPKNYLFSCQPNLSPIACAAPAPSYGSAGAYSAPVPTYVAPYGGNYGGLQQQLNGAYVAPQGYGGGYGGQQQYYQY